jgi:hypothetical protein
MQRFAHDQAILRRRQQLGIGLAMKVEQRAGVDVVGGHAEQLGGEAEDDQAED